MKEILKLWYFSILFLRRQRAAFFLTMPLLFIIPPSITLPMILSKELNIIIAGYILLILLLVVIFDALWIQFVGSFFAIVRFKRRFSFLPPATHEGKIAMQSKIDFGLHQAAILFLQMCDMEKITVHSLIGIGNSTNDKDGKQRLEPEQVRQLEIALDDLRKLMGKTKKAFWQKHAVAKSHLLPASFEVYPSIHNYETNPPQKTVPKKKKMVPPSLDMARHTEAINSLGKRTRPYRINWEDVE